MFLVLLLACDPYAKWPDETGVYPWVYTPETDLEPYEEVRWETEDWSPEDDLDIAARYLLKAANHRPGAPVETLDHFEAMRPAIPSLGSGVRLSLVGDVMWVGEQWDTFLDPAADLLDGDLRFGNLETPTSPLHSTDLSELGLYRFNAPPEMLDGLPLDVLQLNNNHTLDVGDDGIDASIAEIEARGFDHAGVDGQLTRDVGGLTVAFLAYSWGNNRRDITSSHDLHIVPFGHPDVDVQPLLDAVADARAGADTVVVTVHWGYEYEYYADPHFMVLARRIVAAGADLVVGSGPHVLQPPELCHVNRPEHVPGVGTCSVRTDDEQPRTAAVLYSLGNFGTIMPTVPCQVGLVATVSLDPDVTGLGWEPVVALRDPVAVHPLANQLDDPDLAAEAARLDLHLGANWRR